MISIFAYRGLI